MTQQCECGSTVEYTIREGNNPGCKEREDIHCPDCGKLLHSAVYNDATVYVRVVARPEKDLPKKEEK